MEKNNLVLLGLVGALGVGAYLYISKNNDNGLLGGGGGAGGGSGVASDPGSMISPITNIFNIAAPTFPDLSGFFTDTGTTTTTTTTAAKKAAPAPLNVAAILFPNISQIGAYNPVAVQANVDLTWPGLTNEQKLAKVNSAPYTTQFKQVAATIYDPKAAQVAAWKTDPLGMKAKLGISSAAGSVPASKKAIIVPATGYQAALITAGTPEQQIEQYSIAPKIIKSNSQYKKVM